MILDKSNNNKKVKLVIWHEIFKISRFKRFCKKYCLFRNSEAVFRDLYIVNLHNFAILGTVCVLFLKGTKLKELKILSIL